MPPLLSPLVQQLEGPCVTINDAHRRGIMLRQLRSVAHIAKELCLTEQWIDHLTAERIDNNSVNLYHLVDNLIKPATMARNCSWVEYVAASVDDQLPKHFVSHWWGEKLEEFVLCLGLFCSRHNLRADACFWVCGYCLRQHDLGAELKTGDPMEEPFAKALLSNYIIGTVMILDKEMMTWARAWVCFEAVITIQADRRLDICTTDMVADGTVVPRMIADGPTGQESSETQGLMDLQFPIGSAQAGMKVVIQVCKASVRNDLHRILNKIGGVDSNRRLSCTPPLQRANYERYNALIRSKFANIVVRMGIIKGNADDVRAALVAVPTLNLGLRDAHGKTLINWAADHAASDPRPERTDIMHLLSQHVASLEDFKSEVQLKNGMEEASILHAFEIEDNRSRRIVNRRRQSLVRRALLGALLCVVVLFVALILWWTWTRYNASNVLHLGICVENISNPIMSFVIPAFVKHLVNSNDPILSYFGLLSKEGNMLFEVNWNFRYCLPQGDFGNILHGISTSHLDAIVGCRTGTFTKDAARLAGAQSIVLVSPFTTTKKLSNREKFPYVFRTNSAIEVIGEAIAMLCKEWHSWDVNLYYNHDSGKDLYWAIKINGFIGATTGFILELNVEKYDLSVGRRSYKEAIRAAKCTVGARHLHVVKVSPLQDYAVFADLFYREVVEPDTQSRALFLVWELSFLIGVNSAIPVSALWWNGVLCLEFIQHAENNVSRDIQRAWDSFEISDLQHGDAPFGALDWIGKHQKDVFGEPPFRENLMNMFDAIIAVFVAFKNATRDGVAGPVHGQELRDAMYSLSFEGATGLISFKPPDEHGLGGDRARSVGMRITKFQNGSLSSFGVITRVHSKLVVVLE